MFYLGALFPKLSEEHNDPEVSFQYAVHRINLDKSLLPDTHLLHRIRYLNNDSFQTVQKGKKCQAFNYWIYFSAALSGFVCKFFFLWCTVLKFV